jgi:ABC-type uncharacterized transport system permease subunit
MGGWIAGISVFCFAASYTVALVLELSRLLFRSGIRGAVMLGFAGAGLLAQVLYLGYRAYTSVTAEQASLPLSSAFDWYLVAALAVVLVYLYSTIYHPDVAFGIFLLPLVLGLIAAAEYLADDRPFTREVAGQFWLTVHLASWLLGTVSVLVGFSAGLMYLVQWRRLKRKQTAPRGLRLPSLETLERLAGRTIGVSGVSLSVGFASAIILNLINQRQGLVAVPWTDPVIWSTAAVTAWVIAAALFSAIYRPARHGHKVAYLTVATGVLMAGQMGITLLGNSAHGGSGEFPREVPAARSVAT